MYNKNGTFYNLNINTKNNNKMSKLKKLISILFGIPFILAGVVLMTTDYIEWSVLKTIISSIAGLISFIIGIYFIAIASDFDSTPLNYKVISAELGDFYNLDENTQAMYIKLANDVIDLVNEDADAVVIKSHIIKTSDKIYNQ